MKRIKKEKSLNEQLEREIKPLTEDENIDTLDEYLEEEEFQDDADDTNPDDPMAQERLMRLKRHRSQMSNIW